MAVFGYAEALGHTDFRRKKNINENIEMYTYFYLMT